MFRPRLFIFFFIIFPFLGCSQSLNPSGSAPGPILAEVNGQPITLEEFERKWERLPEAGQTIYGGPDGRRDFLDELVKRELLLQRARELELDRKPAFRSRLEASRERLLLDAILKKMVMEKIEVTENDIEAYFEMHRNDLSPIEEIRQKIIQERQQLLFDELITLLRAEARIEIADSHLASISHDLENP